MFQRLLSEHEEALIRAERRLLLGMRSPLTQLDAPAEDLAVLESAILQLDELFLLVLVGEFNAGKSALINALLGKRFLPEGVTPTTTQITMVKYGDEPRHAGVENDVALLTYPADWLRDVNLVDTPGTNAVIQRHQQITEDFIPRADLVLFVTSADRPFTESERQFMKRIREWGKKVVVVVNKSDILESEADIDHILQFVEENTRELLGRRATIFPISARQARQAKETFDADARTRLWQSSRFEALERYIADTLDQRERLKLKLLSPLGLSQRLADRYVQLAQTRRELLREDASAAGSLEAQLGTYESGMRRDFTYHLSHIDNVLYALAERGDRFFDENIRLTRFFDLLDAQKLQARFQQEVVADTATQVERQTQELIDWVVEQDYRQWHAVTEYIGQRARLQSSQIVGKVGATFAYDRQALIESIGEAARAAVGSYDKESEARALAESVRLSVAQTAVVEASALGLGALMVKVLATTLADVTGLLAAGALAVAGLYVIPSKRSRAKRELRTKIGELRERLDTALNQQFERELGRSTGRIRDAVAPYVRFVEAQEQSLATVEASLRSAQDTIKDLERQVRAL